MIKKHSNAGISDSPKLKPDDIWNCISKGWTQFIYQSSLMKVSLNIYILK